MTLRRPHAAFRSGSPPHQDATLSDALRGLPLALAISAGLWLIGLAVVMLMPGIG
jgi:hypothetical protein